MTPREGGCSTDVFESVMICSLWNQVVKLMTNWYRDRGVLKAVYEGSIGKIGMCIIVNVLISSEMLIDLT